jgi:hypothetical protein
MTFRWLFLLNLWRWWNWQFWLCVVVIILYYLGKIQTIQLEYINVNECLLQPACKAPSTATGFQIQCIYQVGNYCSFSFKGYSRMHNFHARGDAQSSPTLLWAHQCMCVNPWPWIIFFIFWLTMLFLLWGCWLQM